MQARRIAPFLIFACAAAGGPAGAQSVSNGQRLYNGNIVPGENSCATSACHGATPSRKLNRIQAGFDAQVTKASFATVQDMRFLEGKVSDAQLNDLAAYIAFSTGTVPIYLPVAPAPVLSLGPTSVDFGSVVVGNASVAHALVLSNSGTAALSIDRIETAPSGFTLSHDCPLAPASVGVGGRCTLSVTYTPSTAGSTQGALAITSTASLASVSAALSGRGAAGPAAMLAWRSGGGPLSFPSTPVGSSSAAQSLNLANLGSVPAALASITTQGDQGADFALSGDCLSTRMLASGAQCTLTVSARPQGIGDLAAHVQVLSGDAGNPPAIALSAIGVPALSTPAAPGTGASPDPSAPIANVNANVGGGGCSMLDPNRPLDPLLGVLLALAGFIVWQRRKSGAREP